MSIYYLNFFGGYRCDILLKYKTFSKPLLMLCRYVGVRSFWIFLPSQFSSKLNTSFRSFLWRVAGNWPFSPIFQLLVKFWCVPRWQHWTSLSILSGIWQFNYSTLWRKSLPNLVHFFVNYRMSYVLVRHDIFVRFFVGSDIPVFVGDFLLFILLCM